MKKILSILGIINLIGTITIILNLVACSSLQYNKKELKELKEKNNINTKDGILEWISPQEKLSSLNDRYYFVVWRGDKNHNWRIINFKHYGGQKVIDKYDKYLLVSSNDEKNLFNLFILMGIFNYFWIKKDNGTRFKAVYRWNSDSKPNIDVKNKLKSYLYL